MAFDGGRQRRVGRPPPLLHGRRQFLVALGEAQDLGGEQHALLVEKAESLPHERPLLG